MKILSIHNRYLQPGGEDVAVAAEKALLEAHGHRVVDYHRSNAEIDERGLSKARVAAKAFWAADTVHELERLLGEEKPDIAHFHNTLTMISPAAYYACRRARVPVVQTLHNYRLICPRADLFRSGRICEDCVGRAVPWPAVLHGCYHASRVETAAVASAISLHWLIRTWRRAVDVYITPSEFARSKLVAGGVPAAKLFVKPNFLATDPGRGARQGGYALFSGRFTPIEKLETLLGAWSKLRTDARLKLIGATAEERESMERRFAARGLKNVEVLGWQPRPRLFELLKEAVFFVFPSEWYETFGLSIVEAFACGVPVIATGIGATAELVQDRVTGLRYAPGDADGLAAKMDWAFSHPDDMRTMSENARHVYDNQYTAAKNYPLLVDIYERAVATVKSRDVTGGGARGTEDVGSQRGATTRRRTRAAFAPEKRATFV